MEKLERLGGLKLDTIFQIKSNKIGKLTKTTAEPIITKQKKSQIEGFLKKDDEYIHFTSTIPSINELIILASIEKQDAIIKGIYHDSKGKYLIYGISYGASSGRMDVDSLDYEGKNISRSY